MIHKETVTGGFVIEKTIFGTILAITSPIGKRVKLNDEVISTGKYGVKGLKGRVIHLVPPYQGGRSSESVGCLMNMTESKSFIGGIMEYLKFEDFELNTVNESK